MRANNEGGVIPHEQDELGLFREPVNFAYLPSTNLSFWGTEMSRDRCLPCKKNTASYLTTQNPFPKDYAYA